MDYGVKRIRRQWHEHVALHYSIDNNHRNEPTSSARLWLIYSHMKERERERQGVCVWVLLHLQRAHEIVNEIVRDWPLVESYNTNANDARARAHIHSWFVAYVACHTYHTITQIHIHADSILYQFNTFSLQQHSPFSTPTTDFHYHF